MRFLFASLLLTAAALGFGSEITSTFDTGPEDWASAALNPSTYAINGYGTVTAPDGKLHADEVSYQPHDLFVLIGPSKFLGDQKAYFGGTVSFTLTDTQRDGIAYPSLLLRGNGVSLTYVSDQIPTSAGTLISVPLKLDDAAEGLGWYDASKHRATNAQIVTALQNLDAFGINADWATNKGDSVTLDNVRMAVPEPTTFAALGLGILALRRRRR